MNKKVIWGIIIIIAGIVGIVIGFSTRFSGIEKMQKQIDMKHGKANINWIFYHWSDCDRSSGRCENYSNNSNSWGGGGGAGK